MLSDNFLSIGGFVVGILGLVSSVFFYLKGKRKQQLEYQVTSTKLITKEIADIPNLKINVGNEPATSLTSTTVRFINNGNQTIKSSDFASSLPLQITVSEHFFNAENIDESYIKTRHKSLNPNINVIGEDRITIEFEYLKPKQEFEFTVLHDGKLAVDGDLKTGSLQNYDFTPKRSTRKFISMTLYPVLVVIVGAIFAPMLFSVLDRTYSKLDSLDYIIDQSSDLIIDHIISLQDNIDELQSTIANLEHENTQLREELLLKDGIISKDVNDLINSDPN